LADNPGLVCDFKVMCVLKHSGMQQLELEWLCGWPKNY